MDDLISRSALIEELEKQCPDWQKTSMGFLIKGAIDDCIQIVKRQPTAYNVDKVCEQLDEMSYVEERNPLDPFSSVETKVVELSDAKKIVKAGGANG